MQDRVDRCTKLKTMKAKIVVFHHERLCPVADSHVFGVDLDRVEDDYDRRDYFAANWQVKTCAEGTGAKEEVHWGPQQAFVNHPATGDMRVCLGEKGLMELIPPCARCVYPDAKHLRDTAVPLCRMISSQLLLYRLVSVFELVHVASGIEWNVVAIRDAGV
jgi:hypothetical protein